MITGYNSFKEAYVLRKECTHWQTYPSSRKSMKGFKDKYIFKVGRIDPLSPVYVELRSSGARYLLQFESLTVSNNGETWLTLLRMETEVLPRRVVLKFVL